MLANNMILVTKYQEKSLILAYPDSTLREQKTPDPQHLFVLTDNSQYTEAQYNHCIQPEVQPISIHFYSEKFNNRSFSLKNRLKKLPKTVHKAVNLI